jgi:nitrate reductase gamma subunit
MEVVFFRSLFRNTKAVLNEKNNLGYGSEKGLWLGGLLFHWSFFYIVIRHLRFFTSPTPAFLGAMETIDGLLQIGVPVFYLTDAIFLLSVSYLFLRRVIIPQVKYISQTADFFPLFLIGGIGLTGIYMRYFSRVDIISVKELTIGLVSFSPSIPAHLEPVFFMHIFFVSILLVYFPFSKLMHMAGIFFSPTRNLPGNTRLRRHVNPWDYPVKVHTYEEYEDEFRDVMKGAGLPVDKE